MFYTNTRSKDSFSLVSSPVRFQRTDVDGLTGPLEAMSDGPRPADAVDQRTEHVTPEVVRPVVTLLVDQTEPTADHLRQKPRITTSLKLLWTTPTNQRMKNISGPVHTWSGSELQTLQFSLKL